MNDYKEFSMEDVKIVTVIVGDGGKVRVVFNKELGELRIYPNEQELKTKAGILYELIEGASTFCIGDDVDELLKVEKE